MTAWPAEKIREEFLSFFKTKGHQILPSASLIPGDPTVLLTLAGMLPFKPIFLGLEPAPKPAKRATSQKCLRMNDLEHVGRTARHHTFFEMLGNFSFGDYFKKEAVLYAWELLTEIFKINKANLWAAVYQKDDETYQIWLKEIGLSGEKVVRLGEENNFWAAGPIGPCGPCSEIYYDFGPKYGCAAPNCQPGCDCDRFLEVWNLVFMEFNRNEKGELEALPKKNIDTGMGLERIAAVLQGVHSNFQTDIFKTLIEEIWTLAARDSQNSEKEIFVRIIADHSRAITFLLADGVIPSNEGRGYVLRRLLRRALLYGHKLGIKKEFLNDLSRAIIENKFYKFYPELKENQKRVKEIIMNEEQTFRRTLGQGAEVLEKLIKKQKKVTGQDAFKLYDTFGFPFEMTEEIVREAGLTLEKAEEFVSQLANQKERSRGNAVFEGVYGEQPKGGEGVVAQSEAEKIKMAEHHTATHLLHAALRQVLGPEAEQSGSLVLPERLRFDFKHFRALTESEIEKIENLVNEKIRENIPAEIFETSLDEAKKLGALALFGEKYGQSVRVVKIGNFSQELCGGTHLTATGQIGSFKILADSAIAAGFRRIEAVAGRAAEIYLARQTKDLRQIGRLLNVPPEAAPARVSELLEELKRKDRQISQLKKRLQKNWRDLEQIQEGPVLGVISDFESMEDLRNLSDQITRELPGEWVLFLISINGTYLARISENFLKKGLDNKIFDEVNRLFQSRAGGKPGFVQGKLQNLNLNNLKESLGEIVRLISGGVKSLS